MSADSDETSCFVAHQLNHGCLKYKKKVYRLRVYKGYHTGKCIRRFGGIYAHCRYFIDRK